MSETIKLQRDATQIPQEVFTNTAITTIDASRARQLTEVPKFIREMTWLESLRVAGHITELPDLSANTALRHLSLRSWGMPRVPPQIRGLPLTSLRIAVESLPMGDAEILASLEDLQVLDIELRKATFERIPAALFALPKLRELSIKTWCATLATLEGLPLATGLHTLHLDLQECTLTELPDDVGALNNLQSLFLQTPGVTKLPDSFCRLDKLEMLRLWYAAMTDFPLVLCSLRALKHIDLHQVPITTLPPSIGDLSRLEHLHLEGHRLTSIPPEVGKLQNLKNLKVSGGFIGARTPLATVPDEIGDLQELEVLNLTHNQLRSVPAVWGSLPNIRCIYLSNNPLSTLPDSWSEVPAKSLWLNECEFTELPACVFLMPKLSNLKLTANTFTPAAYAALKTLSLRRYELELPREGKPREPRLHIACPLSDGVLQQITRLGGKISDSPAPTEPKKLTIGGTEYPAAESFRQWIDAVTMPRGLHLMWSSMRYDIAWCAWNSVISDYEMVNNGPWIALAVDQSHSIWVTNLDDENPTDPQVFKVDHDDFHLTEPEMGEGALSGWLAKMGDR